CVRLSSLYGLDSW
nr:immunoglobulin heavy chain junction region [Macaca mulatta]MOW32193.1 immunoglobulin heavy chain junction region [Macaca mulatta]MOW32216.1 immunoglobulin heavy chain junction region [Macaca mulatta]MOW32241.1 immunoglobulin heavy chain junction region [Macaca mulatta]MOW32261.1 immunoglobulin heavy chain junction region [Macaca mulatta]